MLISEKIFKIMDERGISQNEFSRKTGISQSTISDWKRKKTNPSSEKILIICDVLNVTPYELLHDSHPSAKEKGYFIVSEGTDKYELLMEFEQLSPSNKERLMGYAKALIDSSTC